MVVGPVWEKAVWLFIPKSFTWLKQNLVGGRGRVSDCRLGEAEWSRSVEEPGLVLLGWGLGKRISRPGRICISKAAFQVVGDADLG